MSERVHRVQLSAQPSTAVPDRPLHISGQRFSIAASSITARHFLVILPCRLSTLDPWAFSVAGPSLWNPLPDSKTDLDIDRDIFFGRVLRRMYLHFAEAFSLLEMFQEHTLYKLTYVLSCFQGNV